MICFKGRNRLLHLVDVITSQLKLICETGMRISEVLTLNRGDVKDQVVLFASSGKSES